MSGGERSWLDAGGLKIKNYPVFSLAAEKSRVLPIFTTEARATSVSGTPTPSGARSAVFAQSDRRELRTRFIGRVARHTT
jgi:hypothetical protein